MICLSRARRRRGGGLLIFLEEEKGKERRSTKTKREEDSSRLAASDACISSFFTFDSFSLLERERSLSFFSFCAQEAPFSRTFSRLSPGPREQLAGERLATSFFSNFRKKAATFPREFLDGDDDDEPMLPLVSGPRLDLRGSRRLANGSGMPERPSGAVGEGV